MGKHGLEGRLVLGVLSIASSYARNIDHSVDRSSPPDTVEFWMSAGRIWRVRTFSLDHDIQAYIVGGESADWADVAVSHIRKNFDGVLSRLFDVAIADAGDVLEDSAAFENAGLDRCFEVPEDRFIFWKPSREKHYTQTCPA